MNHKHKNTYAIIMFFTSILLLSISIVSSIGIIQNRSFYSDGYIYNSHIQSALSEYCTNVSRYVTSDLTEEDAELFLSQNNGIYYYITNNNTKEIYTNIPDGKSYIDFSAQSNMVSLQYVDNKAPALYESNNVNATANQEQSSADEKNNGFSGCVLIDKNTGGPVSGSFRLMIENGLNLQKILFLESGIFAISLLFGIVLLLVSFKRAIKSITAKMDFIPVDVKLGGLLVFIALWIYLFGTYLYTIGFFAKLTRRVILYGLFVLLTFIILSFFIMLVLKSRQYAADKLKFNQEWENRLTKNMPTWIIWLVLQLVWYYFILTTVSPGSTIYDYLFLIKHKWPMVIVQNVLIFLVFILIGQIQKGKAKYKEEVLSKAQEIANGNLNLDVPVVGNDFCAQIANHINIIKAGYFHALKEQKKSERLKYELVTNISHDLRTPLTSIINYVGLLREKAPAGDAGKYIDHVDTNAKRLNILIDDLFELSKLESGDMQLDISNVDLVLMFKQIVHEYREKMEQNGLELILESTGKQIMRQCDGLKIWRVFDNLINNAVKYSLPGSRIYIYIAEQSEQLIISVKNIMSHRMDFEPEELFLRFKRGDEARNSEGSGLGLAITKSIVELHNGSIAIEIEGDMFKVIIRFNQVSVQLI